MTPYYDDGVVVIYHGDCRELLGGLTADAVFTDPPYHVGLSYESYTDSVEDWGVWLNSWLPMCHAAASVVALTPGYRNLWRYPEPSGVVIRYDRTAQSPTPVAYLNKWEPVLIYGKVVSRLSWDVIETAAQTERSREPLDHPCPKPLSLMRWLIPSLAEVGGTILDPFAGTGGTLRASKDLGRRAVGIEVEERYCEIAAQRCAQEVLDLQVVA